MLDIGSWITNCRILAPGLVNANIDSWIPRCSMIDGFIIPEYGPVVLYDFKNTVC